MTAARRVLVVAYYFPPIGGIGSIRLARFVQCLPDHGWQPTVVAPGRTPHAADPQLRWDEHRVRRAPSFEVPGLRRHLHPDPQIGWYPAAVRAGLRACAGAPFDVVLSSSYPVTAHLVAATVSRRTGVPWVAEFRDPWSDRLRPGSRRERWAAAREAAIARQAAAIVMPSPSWAAHLGERWGREVDVIPNGHDLDPVPGPVPETPVLTYVGTYYAGDQDLRSVWDAVAQLRRDGGGVPRLRFVGDPGPAALAEVEAAGLADLAEVTGRLPHAAAVRAMRASSVLLAAGAAGTGPIARGTIPAKLFEYLGSDVPVLYVGDPQGDAARLLDGQPGCHVADPRDRPGVRAALLRAMDEPRVARAAEHLTRRARTAALAAVLERAAVS